MNREEEEMRRLEAMEKAIKQIKKDKSLEVLQAGEEAILARTTTLQQKHDSLSFQEDAVRFREFAAEVEASENPLTLKKLRTRYTDLKFQPPKVQRGENLHQRKQDILQFEKQLSWRKKRGKPRKTSSTLR